ncbi:ectonucleotide pyrophosphatase/phosphodiesterase [Cytobacillus sp. Hz8]|uniref:alkaline phosphatase family protein n=1 Tax=Cytobacillus sp. Hz8 TaxID=3347168 RepID=UPI0035DBFA65
MNRLTDYLIVISFDCLSALDFPILSTLPHFKELLEKGAYCRNVETIYPSVTYPCHATIVTGKYPNRHGVINNTLLQPGKSSPDWYWQRKYIRGTILYDEAQKRGMKTAALLWPVTAKAKIDYNMPEIFANRSWHHQIPVSLCNGSPLFQLQMQRKFGHIRNGLQQPELDHFVLEAAVDTIVSKKPQLLLIHFTDLDTQRHNHGFSSNEAFAAIERHDYRLGRIFTALKEAGIDEHTTIIALGDHSALDESHAIKPNVLLQKMGLIQVNEKGKVLDWKAYCKSCDGSAYIYLKDEQDDDSKEKILHLLEELMKDKTNGIEKVLSNKDVIERGADKNALFILEAQRDYYFTEYLQGEFIDKITEKDLSEKRYTLASHGYSPEKDNYTTIFMAMGKGIKRNIFLPAMRLIDEGPTLARLLGFQLENTDGRILEELLDYDKAT